MPQLKSILLVDDDSTTNYLNKMLLTRLGVAEQLLVVENGREALATLNHLCAEPVPDCPTLILLDINMPVMNGIEFLEAYQQLAHPQHHSTIIVLLTTSVNPLELARVQQLPVAATLTKPLTAEKIQLILQEHFNVQQRKDPSEE
ncbi:response regulator [Hymenobacter sediminis]|uniref:response regulator n=1 Tax=Hymenobacter sediminis TaxID=2218621 RepID=UPI000DA6D056|nr:response regulator [Hymenobacter sediminis]RPD49588.1 response regulator [Hymenobacter sediminis]